MKKLLAILVAAAFAGTALVSLAADEVKAGGPTDKPGRAAEAEKGSVKAGGATDKPARAAEEQKAGAKKKKKKK